MFPPRISPYSAGKAVARANRPMPDSRPQVKLSSGGHWAWGATCWAAIPVARDAVQ